MRILRNASVYARETLKKEINYHRLLPTNVLLFLTYRCTSRCRSCAMWRRTTGDREMDTDELIRFVDMLAGYPIEHLDLFGGDALLRKDALAAVARAARARKIPRVGLVTNGNLLDERTVDELFEAGVNIFLLSVDGVGEQHDYIRRTEGSFEHLRRIIAYMVKKKNGRQGPKIAINCTVSALNVDSFEKVFFFADEIGADTVSFEYVGEFPPESIACSQVNGCYPEPFYVPQAGSILLSRAQAVLMKRKIKQLKMEVRCRRVYMNTYNIDFLKIENLVTGIIPNRRCCVCRYMIIADPYGNLIPCPFYNTYRLGSLRHQHLHEIWGNGMHRAFIDALDVAKVGLCRRCILGIERNMTVVQSIRKAYLTYVRKGLDEQEDTEGYVSQQETERMVL